MINSVQTGIPVQNNIGVRTSRRAAPLKPLGADIISIHTPMSECMTLSRDFLSPRAAFGGVLNGKPAEFVVKSNFLGFGEQKVLGNIDKKNVEFVCKNKSVNGVYDNKEFSLNVDKGWFGGVSSISGTIDGKEVSLNLKNSELPKDEDFQNLASIVLLFNGEVANVKGNEINGTRPANWKIRDFQEAGDMQLLSGDV